MTQEVYKQILDRLAELIAGTEFEKHVYAVGGCVRDSMIGREIKDIDLVVDLENGGINLSRSLCNKHLLTHEPIVYETYGTTMFRLKDFPDVELEAVQTRKEQYHSDSRKPETAFGTLHEDAMRRDLTVNALYYNISTHEILDPTGGMTDMERNVIRVTSTPDIVYEDDPLRILRAIRFYGQFNTGLKNPAYTWVIDRATFEGMKTHSHRLTIISKERITAELHKMLMTEYPSECLELLKDTGAMHYVIPELEETYDMTQNEYHFGTVWEHTLKVVDEASTRTKDLHVLMASLLHDIGKIRTRTVKDGKVHFYKHELAGIRMVDTILRRLKEPVDMIRDVQFLTEHHMVTKAWKDDLTGFKNEDRLFRGLRKLQYKCGRKRFYQLMDLIHADNMSHAPEHCLPNQVKNIIMISEHMEEDGRDMFDYQLLVDGNDVMEVRQIQPCAEVRDCLSYLITLAFNNPKMTREECISHIKSWRPSEKKRA